MEFYGTASLGHLSWLMMDCLGRPHLLPNISRENSLSDLQPISCEVTFGKGRVVSCLDGWSGGSFKEPDCVEAFELRLVITPASIAVFLIYLIVEHYFNT